MMSRRERRQFFEALCALRDRHSVAGPDDTLAVISIEDAIAEASAELARPLSEGEVSAKNEEAV